MKEKDKRIREWKMRGKLKNETFGKTQIVVFILCSLACFMFYVVSLSLSLAFVSGDIFCVILIYKGTLQQKNVTTAKDKLCERVKVFLSFDFKDLTAKVTESLLFCFIQSH
jgi:cytochrome c oxidase assembly protein Cox11